MRKIQLHLRRKLNKCKNFQSVRVHLHYWVYNDKILDKILDVLVWISIIDVMKLAEDYRKCLTTSEMNQIHKKRLHNFIFLSNVELIDFPE